MRRKSGCNPVGCIACLGTDAGACEEQQQWETEQLIELNEASYGYGQNMLLRQIDLTIPEGAFYFLTGPSGAGKTTFLRLCYGELFPLDGEVRLLEQNPAVLSRDKIAQLRRRIGVVHQDCQFLDHLSVAENIALPFIVAGRDPLDHSDELNDLIRWVGLEDRRTAKPDTLSGGERQRAALARAVILSPDILIADEPTGNIDWDMGQRVMTLLCELNRMGKTVLIATHDMNLIRTTAAQVTAKVLRLKDGVLSKAGTNL